MAGLVHHWKARIAGAASFDSLAVILFGLIIPFLLGSSTTLFEDGDVGWHIAAGQWMVEHGAVPSTDPFSYPAFGQPWVAHEWLSEALMGVAFNLGGFAGVAVLMSAALALLMTLIALELRRWLDTPRMVLILAAVLIVLMPFLHARPMLLTWPLVAGWTLALMRARDRDQAPPLSLAGVMILWVNLHASFALGLLLAAAFALEALVTAEDKKKAFIRWLVFGLACLVATLINPQGFKALLIPLGAFASPSITLIQEFKPTDMTFTPGFELALLLLVALSLWRGLRLGPVRVLILLGLLHLALAHMRHQALFVIVAALLIARPLGSRIEARQSVADALGFPGKKRVQFLAGAVGLVLALTVMTASLVRPPKDTPVYPMTALTHLPKGLERAHVLNSYKFGGPLILRGIRPFIDGRTDAYGERFVLDYKKLLDGDAVAFAQAQRKWEFRWTLIAPSDDKMLAMVDKAPGWRRVYADRYAVIHVRG